MPHTPPRARLRRALLLAVALPLAACETATSATAPGDDPATARGGSTGKPNSTIVPMGISPGVATVAVGATTSLQVTYWDKRGQIVPTSDFRWTYYGCRAVSPAGVSCYDLVDLVPAPGLREVAVTGKAAGVVEVYAADGLGTEVAARVTVQ